MEKEDKKKTNELGMEKEYKKKKMRAGSNSHCTAMMQPNRSGDKHKPNPSPTLTPSPFSFNLPLKVNSGL